jgi:hypothetical protein
LPHSTPSVNAMPVAAEATPRANGEPTTGVSAPETALMW